MSELRKSMVISSLLGLPLLASAGAICSDLIVSLDAQAEVNATIGLPTNLLQPDLLVEVANTVAGSFGDVWPLVPVAGTYNISATYCEPDDSEPDTVQLLNHGGTYNKEYFTGHGLESDEDLYKYSWTHYAANEGYASLSIDRLGQGNTKDADPLLEVQVNLQAEIAALFAKKLRDGKIVAKTDSGKIGGRKFKKVVYVGHSLGSLIGSVTARRNATSFDGFVLTGWSDHIIENFLSILRGILQPAPLVDATKWGDVHPAFLVFTNEEAMRQNFFADDGTFDPEIRARDWERRGTLGLIELVGVFSGMKSAPEYPGPVHVVNGEFDALVCTKGPRCAPGEGNVPDISRDNFRKADYSYSIINATGHDLNLHYSARQAYKAAHEFIRNKVA